MRYNYLILAIILGFAPISLAQSSLKAGIQLGFNYAGFNQSETPYFQFENTLNFSHGVFFEIPFTPFISFRTSFSVVPRGVYIKPNSTNIMKQRIKLSYFEIPLLAKLTLPFNLDNLKFILIGGPTFGFSLQNYVSIIRNGQEIIYTQQQWSDTDGGVIIGAGIEGKRFSVTIQNYQGINKLPLDFGPVTLKNQYISIVLNYFMNHATE